MYRRDFLKLGGLATAALFLQVNPLGKIASQSAPVASQGKLYRGTYDGKVLVSTDAGKTWKLHTNFGSQFSVTSMVADLFSQVHARLEFDGYPVHLALMKNGNHWQTT